jgi:hypothetical protein
VEKKKASGWEASLLEKKKKKKKKRYPGSRIFPGTIEIRRLFSTGGARSGGAEYSPVL